PLSLSLASFFSTRFTNLSTLRFILLLPLSLPLSDISNFLKGECLICNHQTSIVQRSLLHILLLFSTGSCHAHHHHFLCVSFDESEHVAVVMVSSSPPWSPVSSSHRLAPSSPSRARSVVTVSNSLRRQRSQARSVTTTLELAPKVIDGEGDRENT
ncbi:unnamed protein product, partial [Brassica oleracea var. botrytis]